LWAATSPPGWSAPASTTRSTNIWSLHGGGRVSQDLPQYVLLAAGILIANSVLLHALTALSLPAPAAKLITEMTLFAVSFSVQTLVIFRKKKPIKEERTIHVHA